MPIVVAISSGGRLLAPAAVAAVLALILLVSLGLWLHRPLATVPENAFKFGVGVMLGAFGAFWVGEGISIANGRAPTGHSCFELSWLISTIINMTNS